MRPSTKEEFRAALFSMYPDKSSGPDGFNPGFYPQFWDILGDDIFSTCSSWLQSSHIPREVQSTTIVLLPKKNVVETMKDLSRPSTYFSL
ncbi:hypothetical protein LINGRAHAP2_LOCUS10794 [Linum grandiflorum]